MSRPFSRLVVGPSVPLDPLLVGSLESPLVMVGPPDPIRLLDLLGPFQLLWWSWWMLGPDVSLLVL